MTILEKIQKYLKETLAELRKMTWPTKEELIGSTTVTVIVSFIVAVFIGIVDRILTFGIHLLFGRGAGG